jgi:hypothetical protein
LRQAWEELHSAAGSAFDPDILGLLGGKSDTQSNPTSVEPRRGRLHIEDFLDRSERDPEIRYRISIDEERGSVGKWAFQVLEAPYGVGELITFEGQIHYHALDQRTADQIKLLVETGLRWITSLGAERTIGFGRLIDLSVSNPAPSATPSFTGTVQGAESLELRLTAHSAVAFLPGTSPGLQQPL